MNDSEISLSAQIPNLRSFTPRSSLCLLHSLECDLENSILRQPDPNYVKIRNNRVSCCDT